MKPRLFVGSSVESLEVAYSVQENLEHDVEVTVWTQDIFELSMTSLESLLDSIESFDFGLFVFAPDDITRLRGREHQTVRDNVIFELGLFIGRIGRERSFILQPRGGEGFRLPTDLLGVTPGYYDAGRTDGNLAAALGPSCNKVRKAIAKHGARKRITRLEQASEEAVAAEENPPAWARVESGTDSRQEDALNLALRQLSRDFDGNLVCPFVPKGRTDLVFSGSATDAKGLHLIQTAYATSSELDHAFIEVSKRRARETCSHLDPYSYEGTCSLLLVVVTDIIPQEQIALEKSMDLDSESAEYEFRILDYHRLEKVFRNEAGQRAEAPYRLWIVEAAYHTPQKSLDVTEHLRRRVEDNAVRVVASNDLAGDPHVGMVKELTVRYLYDGRMYSTNVRERSELRLPDRDHEEVG